MASIEKPNRYLNYRILSAPLSLYNTIVSRSFAYYKIPNQMLNLSVLKLDGNCFYVNVLKNATVGEVKQAVEEIFKFSSEIEGQILWSLVWRHFCLCYEGQKLLNDKSSIGSYGIKDGDQLRFIRHMTVHQKPAMKQSCKGITDTKHSIIICRSTSRHDNKGDEIFIDHQEVNLKFHHCEEGEGLYEQEFKLAQYLRGRLSYLTLWGCTGNFVRRGKAPPSRFSLQYAAVGQEDSECMLTVESN